MSGDLLGQNFRCSNDLPYRRGTPSGVHRIASVVLRGRPSTRRSRSFIPIFNANNRLSALAEVSAAKRLPLHTPTQDAVDLPKMVQVVCRFQADELLDRLPSAVESSERVSSDRRRLPPRSAPAPPRIARHSFCVSNAANIPTSMYGTITSSPCVWKFGEKSRVVVSRSSRNTVSPCLSCVVRSVRTVVSRHHCDRGT
jgi:hypothetical protein